MPLAFDFWPAFYFSIFAASFLLRFDRLHLIDRLLLDAAGPLGLPRVGPAFAGQLCIRSNTSHLLLLSKSKSHLNANTKSLHPAHSFQSSTSGQDLLDVVIKHLNLLETSYFGLKYLPQAAVAGPNGPNQAERLRSIEAVWLDVDKSALKQLKGVQPMTVYFGVKYYATDPCKLAEEITRYQFFLQCKQDILHSRLSVSFELAVELFALAIQSELGDYDPQRHRDGYVAEFQFVANQSSELERRAAIWHRQLTGQVPATAELNFLERIKWLDLYGCQLHPIQYDDDSGDQYALGLNPTGVLVLRNRLKVAQYLWSRIVKTKCQGRCFLMDVVQETADSGSLSRGLSGSRQGAGGPTRNRFGFRLADKDASQRLRWCVEEHKSFYHLIHSTATLNQLARRQQQEQQDMKFSQRFRNSIRSAISISHLSGSMQQQLAQQQQRMLRSSVKSLNNAALLQRQHQECAALDRTQPAVVRMPSRRYSNRSLTRPFDGPASATPPANCYAPDGLAAAANGNGLPAPGVGMAHTMVESQRHQALIMMNQLNQINGPLGKSQTLKPMSKESKEARRTNPYYQMMMMIAAQQHQQRQQQQQQAPEVSVLPPGHHIVQPSIYRASSVVNGINQLAGRPADVILRQQQPTVVQQLFNGRPQYPPVAHHQMGHESPRSTRSAMAPSSALKLASKKLAKQQQQLFYGNQTDLKPLLYSDRSNNGAELINANYYTPSADHYGQAACSANPSPRSTRSARLAGSRKQRSKSTGENLHLLHKNQNALNKISLLATAPTLDPMMPPPDYHTSQVAAPLPPKQRHQQLIGSDNESQMGKRGAQLNARKRTTFAPDASQASLSLRSYSGNNNQKIILNDDDEDDYYCSRSDCSSVDVTTNSLNKSYRHQRDAGGRERQARFINGQLINSGQVQQHQQQCKPPKRSSASKSQQAEGIYSEEQPKTISHQDWNAIKRRHNEFSSGKGLLGQLDATMIGLEDKRQKQQQQQDDRDTNNNNNHSNNLVKNIANKQATPILLSMNYDQNQQLNNCNNKAVQLLNLQRQQLNSQSSDGSGTNNNKTSGGSTSVVSGSSEPSSVASSPKALAGNHQRPGSQKSFNHHAADSTASNSTTSGYYAGSNSTGSASMDSDTICGVEAGVKSTQGQSSLATTTRHTHQASDYSTNGTDWRHDASRPKVASYPSRATSNGNRLLIGNPQNFHQTQCQPNQNQQVREYQKQQQQFYLGETNNNEDCPNASHQPMSQSSGKTNHQQQWSPLEQIQQHAPSSLKYVSFDV